MQRPDNSGRRPRSQSQDRCNGRTCRKCNGEPQQLPGLPGEIIYMILEYVPDKFICISRDWHAMAIEFINNLPPGFSVPNIAAEARPDLSDAPRIESHSVISKLHIHKFGRFITFQVDACPNSRIINIIHRDFVLTYRAYPWSPDMFLGKVTYAGHRGPKTINYEFSTGTRTGPPQYDTYRTVQVIAPETAKAGHAGQLHGALDIDPGWKIYILRCRDYMQTFEITSRVPHNGRCSIVNYSHNPAPDTSFKTRPGSSIHDLPDLYMAIHKISEVSETSDIDAGEVMMWIRLIADNFPREYFERESIWAAF